MHMIEDGGWPNRSQIPRGGSHRHLGLGLLIANAEWSISCRSAELNKRLMRMALGIVGQIDDRLSWR